MLTPLHAQVAGDCAPVRAAISNRINHEYSRVDAAAVSVASDVARARSCVDALLEQINALIPDFGGGLLGNLIGGLAGNLASGACQLIQSTANEAVGQVNGGINQAISGAGQVTMPSQLQTWVAGQPQPLGMSVQVPATAPASNQQATPPASQSVWQRALSAVW